MYKPKSLQLPQILFKSPQCNKHRYVPPIVTTTGALPKITTITTSPTPTMMSCPLSILGCFQAANELLKSPQQWTGTTKKQEIFLRRYLHYLPETVKLKNDLIYKASRNEDEINDWLRQNGWSNMEVKIADPQGFATACILDVMLNWTSPGTVTSIKGYPAVHLTKDDQGVRAFNMPIHPHPIVSIGTQGLDTVYMTIATERPKDEVFDLIDKINNLRCGLRTPASADVKFPMVSMEASTDISFLHGTASAPSGYFVDDAKQMNRFRMNEIGARAQSVTTMCYRMGSSMERTQLIVIDKPFILWIERVGLNLPVFAGYFAEDSWKKPQSIEQSVNV